MHYPLPEGDEWEKNKIEHDHQWLANLKSYFAKVYWVISEHH